MSSVLGLRRDLPRRDLPALGGRRYAHGYSEPVVDHAEERVEALRRYDAARR
jgi:hypothetical protein